MWSSGSGLENRDRRAEGHQPVEAQDRGIPHTHAPMRDAARQDLRLIRPVDADEAPAEPVGELRGARVQSEGARSVSGRGVARELLANIELAPRGGKRRLADADDRAEDRPPVAVE